jgi:hypothetical protein
MTVSVFDAVAERTRSVSLDSAALDLVKYAKALMACRGQRDDALALATARGASSRLQTMFKTAISSDKISDDILTKAPVAIGSVGGSTWGDELAPVSGKLCSLRPIAGTVQRIRSHAV